MTPSLAGQEPNWGIVIHGGAGDIERGRLTPAREAAHRAKLEEALRAGHAVLAGGGTSLDAVQAAIRVLEDSPLFNAGRGAVRTFEGVVELDASLMDGRDLRAGAVAGVRRVRNPIDLAREVMDGSPHVLLAGAGAEEFAQSRGLELVPPDYFLRGEDSSGPAAPAATDTDAMVPAACGALCGHELGTVGAVALDRHGNIAAGTSTGGLAGKRWGRVGDSPIIGAGTYADNRCGGISSTGHGEYFIRGVVAYDICAITMYQGIPLRDAADGVVMGKLVEMGGEGGVIAMDAEGVPSMSFNTPGMFRGYLGGDGRLFVEMYRE